MTGTRPVDWESLGSRRLKRLIAAARAISGLKRLGPRAADWIVDLSFVSAPRMRAINSEHLGKDYPTDVLSFPAPPAFLQTGLLGELVICTSVMKRQARERGLEPEMELHILLAHGILHLLGLDHEKGAREMAEMVRWEQRLLEATVPRQWIKATQGGALKGLIERAS